MGYLFGGDGGVLAAVAGCDRDRDSNFQYRRVMMETTNRGKRTCGVKLSIISRL